MARKPSGYPFPTAGAERIKLDAHLVEGFVEIFLMDQFDSPQPTPDLHREIWRMFCSSHPYCATAAPRGHAKSGAGTFSYGMASALFGEVDFGLIIGASEDMAAKHLADMAVQMEENIPLIETFNIKVLTNNETELVARVGGREFCFLGRGAGQKVRGIKWRQKRPQLVLIDDLEDDEAVMNPDRRAKMRDWFFNAVLPCGSDNARFRMVGTILHLDSLLERLLNDDQWLSKRFRAHTDFDDFSNILWPDKFPEKRLRAIRQQYINQGNASGYSQEYLSHPVADLDSYFRRDDFLPMADEDYHSPKLYYASADFAISQKERSDNTSLSVGGVDPESILHIVDNRAGRWDALEIMDEMFEVQRRWEPEFWVVESGAIWKAMKPLIEAEMTRRGVYLNLIPQIPTKDKQSRARAIQARMRAGGVRFDKSASWYSAYEHELLSFPRGIHDDRVDSTAWLGIGIEKFAASDTLEEMEYNELSQAESAEGLLNGRNATTGY